MWKAFVFVALFGSAAFVIQKIDREVSPPPFPRTPAFLLCVRHSVPPFRAHVPSSPELVGASALAMNESERAELTNVLGEVNDRLVALANPLFIALDDDDPNAPLAAWSKHGPVALTVAHAAAREFACATDGLCARIDPHACPADWEEVSATGRERERAKFLVWPWAYSVRVRARTEAAAEAIAKILREHGRESKRIGLVLQANDGSAVDAVAPELAARWKRHEALDALRKDDRLPPSPAPRTAIDAFDVLVLPRIDTIIDRDAFIAEVRTYAHGARVAPALP